MPTEEQNEPEKDPSVSEDSGQPLTEEQRAQIERLGGEDTSPNRELTQAEAADLIDQLGHRTESDSE